MAEHNGSAIDPYDDSDAIKSNRPEEDVSGCRRTSKILAERFENQFHLAPPCSRITPVPSVVVASNYSETYSEMLES